MANLLINEEKKKLQRDLLLRKLVVASFALTLLLFFATIVLGAFWLSLVIRQGIVPNISSSVGQGKDELTFGPSDPVALLEKVRGQVKIINSYWSEPVISEIIAQSLAPKPMSLKISGLTLERLPDGKINLALSGVAPSRASLITYANALRQENFFSTVDLPVESLISGEGGQFIINLSK